MPAVRFTYRQGVTRISGGAIGRLLRSQCAYTNEAADLQRVADVETCLDGFENAANVKIVPDSDDVAGHILQLAGFEQGMV